MRSKILGALLAAGLVLGAVTSPWASAAPDGPRKGAALGRWSQVEAANKARYLEILDVVRNQQQFGRIPDYYAEDFIQHNRFAAALPGTPQEKVASFFRNLYGAFPDWHGEVVEIVAERDKVFVLTRWKGTFTGTYYFAGQRIVGKGQVVEIETADLVRFEDGKAAEHWDVADNLGLLRGAGVTAPVPRWLSPVPFRVGGGARHAVDG
jgi:predicted SnoaL-like aldol condensation-catalyzing enzyme